MCRAIILVLILSTVTLAGAQDAEIPLIGLDGGLGPDLVWHPGASPDNRYSAGPNGSLWLTAAPNTTYYVDTFSAPVITYPTSGDFSATITVLPQFQTALDAALFGLRAQGAPAAYLNVLLMPELLTVDHMGRRFAEMTVPGGALGLRLTRTGDSFDIEFSSDGAAWEALVLGYPLELPADIEIMLGALSLDEQPSRAQFSALRVQGASATEPSSIPHDDNARPRAISAYDTALAAESSPNVAPADRRELWGQARSQLQAALRFNREDGELIELTLTAQSYLDGYDHTTPITLTELRAFEPGVQLRSPIMGPDWSLYVVDGARGAIYREPLSPGGDTTISPQPELIIAPGMGGRAVGRIIDIEWSAYAGALLGLDEDGLLITYRDGNLGTQQLVLPASWNQPVALTVWRQNIYVLDRSQLWRYVPQGGVYTVAPEPYFSGAERPDLSAAVDVGIDDRGSVYILLASGEILNYFAGEPDEFALTGESLPAGGLTRGGALYVLNHPLAGALWVVDAGRQAIYQVSYGGLARAGYRPRDVVGDPFDAVGGVVANGDSGHLHIVAGDRLYLAAGVVR